MCPLSIVFLRLCRGLTTKTRHTDFRKEAGLTSSAGTSAYVTGISHLLITSLTSTETDHGYGHTWIVANACPHTRVVISAGQISIITGELPRLTLVDIGPITARPDFRVPLVCFTITIIIYTVTGLWLRLGRGPIRVR